MVLESPSTARRAGDKFMDEFFLSWQINLRPETAEFYGRVTSEAFRIETRSTRTQTRVGHMHEEWTQQIHAGLIGADDDYMEARWNLTSLRNHWNNCTNV